MLVNTLLNNLLIGIPELFFLGALLVLVLWSLHWNNTPRGFQKQLTQNVTYLVAEIHLIVLLLSTANLRTVQMLFFGSFRSTPSTVILKLFLLGSTLLFLQLTVKLITRFFWNQSEFPLLIGFTTWALLLCLLANDFLTLYLSLELQSLCLYILASFTRDSQLSAEAGLKYFILGALASSFFLFGISLIYGFTGSLNFIDIIKILASGETVQPLSHTLKVGVVFLLCGFFFKLAAVPFHSWSPDVYEGTPLSVMIFFMTIPKFALLCVFTKLLYTVLFDTYMVWQPLLVTTSFLTITFSSIAAVYQRKIKRFLAYTAINHVGFMLLSLATGTRLGIHAFFLYLFLYLITTLTFFSAFSALQKKNTGRPLVYWIDFLNLKSLPTVTRVVLSTIFLSMAGLPPLMGFFAKFYVLFAAMDAHFYWLLTISIACSTLSTFYYLRLIKIMWFERGSPKAGIHWNLDLLQSVYLGVGFSLILLFFLAPDWFITTIYTVSQALIII